MFKYSTEEVFVYLLVYQNLIVFIYFYSDVEMFSPEVEEVAALLLLPAVHHLFAEPTQIFRSDEDD